MRSKSRAKRSNTEPQPSHRRLYQHHRPTPDSCSLWGLRTSWASEPLTELTRTDTELALERAAQSAFRAKSCLVCNLRELQLRGLQQGPSKLASQLLDRFGRSDTCGRDELAVKGACRLAGTRCKCLVRQAAAGRLATFCISRS
jgi:hypothetical protein